VRDVGDWHGMNAHRGVPFLVPTGNLALFHKWRKTTKIEHAVAKMKHQNGCKNLLTRRAGLPLR
jgi:hypothetical protein